MSASPTTLNVIFQRGERWICQNSNCGAEIIVVASSGVRDGTSPRCTCGSNFSNLDIAPPGLQLALRALLSEMARPLVASTSEDTPADEKLVDTKETAA